MKKKFDCGHIGKGKFCHKCKQIRDKLETERSERAERASIRTHDVLDFKGIPLNIVIKTKEILGKIEKGASWQELQGKLLVYPENMISIKVSREYRLLIEYKTLKPIKVLSHEEYNHLFA